MSNTNNDDDLPSKRICHECVRESFLSAQIEQSAPVATCDYCGELLASLTIEELADRIETAFEEHYNRTSDQPNSWEERMLADKESHYDWERDGTPVVDAIADAAEIPQGAAEDVLAILEERHGDFDKDAMGEESEFSSDSYYEEKNPDDQGWQEEWHNFEHSLKTQARFFSHTAANHLAQVFGDIDKLKTRDGRPLVVGAGPETALDHLYRARVFQAVDKLEEALRRPDLYLGSPPPRLARAGRMNAQGISVFYGATDVNVAIAEVRAPVGSKVAVAKFGITRPLRLLDLTALEDVHDTGSIFDSSLKQRLERASFLRTLGSRMARPVMPDDEVVDYLPTQAVADFLATMNEPRLDGIIFPSAQARTGRNVVLFHHAARVVETSLPKGTEIEASIGSWTEDGWEFEYSVSELIPPQPAQKQSALDEGVWDIWCGHPTEPPCWDDDFREAALKVEPDALEVHHVDSVKVNSTAYAVDRRQYVKQEPKF
ncbi:RES family NAD+ phosphorylase [Ralstonia nicotianae]|uniref:RES domain-containing protein n=2 Tax=Ralstonia solanacearum species complex TaxID=3116862 RepID=A0ABX7ZVC9_9RALS|nr:RES family NAD+ phosphorylase [Ralstonia nicotianae]QUP59266.1 RES domain-containing protein [Ralstonia nicotianae]